MAGYFTGRKKRLYLLKATVLFNLTLVILYLVSLKNYLIFHSLAEIFSIIIGGAIFLVVWNARSFIDDNFLIITGTGILFVVIMDLIYTLAYEGVSVFRNPTMDAASQLWIVARYMQSLLFIAAVLLMNHRINKWFLLITFSSVNLLIYGSIFLWDFFPVCYVEGQGFTLFKIINEYLIIAFFLVTMWVFYSIRTKFNPKMYRLFQTFFLLSILSELCFTYYLNTFIFVNFIGYVTKIYAFYALYSAFVSEAYIEPYRKVEVISGQNIHRLKVAIKGSNVSAFSMDMEGVCIWAFNPAFNIPLEEFIGKKPNEAMPPEDAKKMTSIVEHVITTGESIHKQRLELSRGDLKHWFELSVEPARDSQGTITELDFSLIDITEHVTMQNELKTQAQKLNDHMREIQCLFSIMKTSRQQQKQEPATIFEEIAGIIPQGFAEDASISAQITVDGVSYASGQVPVSLLIQETLITVNDIERGNIKVYYLRPSSTDCSEELHANKLTLLKAVADEIGLFIERNDAEKLAGELQERYERIFNGVQDAIFLESFDGVILDVNDRACTLYGYEKESFVGKNIQAIIKEDQPVIKFPEVKQGKYYNPELYESIHKKSDGTYFPVELSGHKFNFGDDNYLITVIRDVTERKKTEDAITNSLNRLTTLHNIERTINTTLDMELSLNLILEEVHRALKLDACNLLIFNKELNTLEYKNQIGFYSDILHSTSLRPGQGLAGKTALEREPMLLSTLSNERERRDSFLEYLEIKEGINAYFAFPLLAKGKLMGVLEIMHRKVFYPDTDWIKFAGILSEQIANAIDSGLMFQDVTRTNFQLRTAYDLTLKKFAKMLARQNIQDEDHIDNIAMKTVELAERLNVRGDQLNKIYRGAVLHDIGEAAIPNTFMVRSEVFSDQEREIIHKHPLFAAEILSDVPYLKQVLDIPLYHHERWDGSGYPYGLSGDLIPLPARIFAVVDVWDALCSDRPWRKAWPKAEATEYVKNNEGILFDPKVVNAFIEMVV